MKLREVFRYELGYRLRSASTWAYAAILSLIALFFLAGPGGDATGHANAPARLAEFAVIAQMFGMLVSAAIFGDAALRDVEAGMDPLLFTSALSRGEYLGGRFLAALVANAIVLVAIPLGQIAATVAFNDPGELGPYRVSAYLQPYLLLLLPNLVVIGSILFTVAVRARQAIPVYLGTIAFFICYLVVINYRAHLDSPVLSMLVDPLAMAALQDMTRYWTEAEQNARPIGFPAMLVWNRVVWLGVAAIVFAFLLRTFRFAHPDGGGRRPRERAGVACDPAPAVPLSVPRAAGSFGFRTTARQTLAVARQSFAEIATGRVFIAVVLACTFFAVVMSWDVGESVFDTSTWPVTFLVTGTALSERIVPIIYLLIAVYAGELVWKNREVGVAEIADAAPVPEGVALLGRFLALVAMLAVLQLALMFGGILIQALQGYTRFEPALYLQVLFGLNLTDFVLLAVLAMTIHVVVNQKYLGHFLVLLACVFTVVARMFGIRHNLLIYSGDPGWTYSDMNGFGPFVGPIVWFRVYWAAWALLLAVIASVLWVRGREPGFGARLRGARARLGGAAVRTAGVALALMLLLGGFIFYNTNVLNAYHTPEESGAPLAEYERRYGRFEDVPQPAIAAADLRIEIHPDAPAVDIRGTYVLVNRTPRRVDSLHVYVDTDVDARSISLDRGAKPVLVDEALGYRIWALERALAPGDSLRLTFDVAFRPRGFPNSGGQTEVVGNGAYFNRSWLPFIGYQPALELSDREERKRFGLAPRPPAPGPEDVGARRYRYGIRNEDAVHVGAVIGTAADQIAVTPGVLRRSWTENGRRYFHYETEAPTSFGATVFSAEYAVLVDRWKDVALRIYHHPAHRYNLDRTVRSMKASLEYFTGQFGPYPDRELRIVEIPRYGGFGRAHPHTIAFTEDYFLSRVREGEIDQPFYGTAHEVAHQWWGGQVRGAPVRGHGFLSESLANYSAMMVTEKTYGPEVARRVYDFQMERYLNGRARFSREVPLLEVEDQPYIAYRKGAIAMYTLREQVGEERVNGALRRYVRKHRDGEPPYPTSLDLYAELRAVTPGPLRYLLRDLFEEVTLWDVETERAVAEPTGTGEYRVTIDVVARKVRADSAGRETEVPMNDFVEIGVFAPGGDDGLGAPLYLKRHRIRSGRQTIRVTVPREPARAGVDPYRKLIERRRQDNVADLPIGGKAPRPAGPSFS